MLHSTKLDFKFWGELLLTAAYTYNVTGHSSIELKTPHEVLFGESPSLNHLRVIGTSCTYLEENVTFKFNPNGHSAILLGYVPFSKTYKLWDISYIWLFYYNDYQIKLLFMGKCKVLGIG